MAHIDVPLSRSGFGQTRRVDNWWVQPLVVFLGSLGIHCLCHVGRIAGPALSASGPISRPFIRRNCSAPDGWFGPNAALDAGLGDGGDAHSLGAGRISRHLLLLSRSLLQSVLGRSAFLHRGRAAQNLSWRTVLSSNRAKHSPLFSLPGAGVPAHSGTRRVGCVLVQRPLRYRRRHAGPADQLRAVELRTPSAATRFATSSAAFATGWPAPQPASRSMTASVA